MTVSPLSVNQVHSNPSSRTSTPLPPSRPSTPSYTGKPLSPPIEVTEELRRIYTKPVSFSHLPPHQQEPGRADMFKHGTSEQRNVYSLGSYLGLFLPVIPESPNPEACGNELDSRLFSRLDTTPSPASINLAQETTIKDIQLPEDIDPSTIIDLFSVLPGVNSINSVLVEEKPDGCFAKFKLRLGEDLLLATLARSLKQFTSTLPPDQAYSLNLKLVEDWVHCNFTRT